jgi:cyclic beta-1,2-glucan synthetase
MFRVAVESILGFSTENGDTIVMNPSISNDWPKARLTYRLPDGKTRFEITIENPHGKERGVTSASLDGEPVPVADGAARVPMKCDGEVHRVVVRL